MKNSDDDDDDDDDDDYDDYYDDDDDYYDICMYLLWFILGLSLYCLWFKEIA